MSVIKELSWYQLGIILIASATLPLVISCGKLWGGASFLCPIKYAWNHTGTTWNLIGNAQFFNTGTFGNTLALDNNSIPYVAFRSITTNNLVVMKYSGQVWNYVGNPATPPATITNGPFITIDSSGLPLVLFEDNAFGSKASVVKFDGTNWNYLGNPAISSGASNYLSIAADSRGTPYILYTDGADLGTVRKYDGSSWVAVGSTSFSPTMQTTSLALDGNNTPYVAFGDFANAAAAAVMKFDGSNWNYVGARDFSAGQVFPIVTAIAPSGTPYVAYSDWANGQSPTVMKFNGSSWVPVGNVPILSGAISYINIVFDSKGTPYITFPDPTSSNKVTVMKFDGANWSAVGLTGFSPYGANYPTLAIDKCGAKYASFGSFSSGATVMGF